MLDEYPCAPRQSHPSVSTDAYYDAHQVSMSNPSRRLHQVLPIHFFPFFPVNELVILPSPNPPNNLSMPNPPNNPFTNPPNPNPLSNLPTMPSTPASNSPTAAIIWNSGSDSRYHSGLSAFLACGMSAIFFLAFSMVVTMVVVSSLSELASWCSSLVASPEAARDLALAAMWPSGSRPRIAPLHSWRMRLPSSILGLTFLTSSSSSSSSLGLRSAASMSWEGYVLVDFQGG